MARDPERRAASREADRLRKRARRAAERYERLAAETTSSLERSRLRQEAAEARRTARDIRATRGEGGRWEYSTRAQAATAYAREMPTPTAREIRADRLDMAEEFRKARRGERSALGERGRERTQLFYQLTKDAWQGHALSQRNDAIMRALGVDTLEEAYLKVARTPQFRRVMRSLDTSGGKVKDTDAMDTAYREAERSTYRIDTPQKITRASARAFAKAYGFAR